MTLITTQGLHKTYQTKTGPVRALDGLNLSVGRGTVRGLLGPNGAGKTILVKVLTALLHPGSRGVSVIEVDVLVGPAKVRPLIGTSDQYMAMGEALIVRENLVLVSRLYRIGTRRVKRRVEEPFEAFDLIEAADWPLKDFSDGMRRCVDLAGALMINPPVPFLDELTTGLDPQARMGPWEVTRGRMGEGTAVLPTTQYLEEADQLADSISMIDRGHVIAKGAVDELKTPVGGKRIELTLVGEVNTNRAQRIVASGTGTEVTVTGRVFMTQVGDPTAAPVAVLKVLDEEGVKLHDAGIRRPTLDGVFPILMGHAAEEQEVVT